jgi:hypothetical protein
MASTVAAPEEATQGAGEDYVRLVSADGHRFYVMRNVAMISGTIKSMLTGPGARSEAATHYGDCTRPGPVAHAALHRGIFRI